MLGLMQLLAEEHVVLSDYFEPAPQWPQLLESMLLERMASRDHYVAVAREERRVVGLVTALIRHTSAFRESPRGMLENLVVARERRRLGIGRRLVEAAVAWCRAQGLAWVELSVAVDNEAGRAFWRALGFEPVMERLARRPGDHGV